MLISCPKCHSIYEIPDNLIGKTGQNLRCHVCANVWHAMREDALGYDDNSAESTPFIEAILLKNDMPRNFPSDKAAYIVPADTKSGRRTKSSKEIIATEANLPSKATETKTENKNEITLTSEQGTSFTISTLPDFNDETDNKTPHLFDNETGIRADKENRLLSEHSFMGYTKTKIFLCVLLLAIMTIFLRREIVAIYPPSENYFNKIMLTGLKNPQYLQFGQISVKPYTKDDKKMLKITAEIKNPSRYATYVPAITISNRKETFSLPTDLLEANQSDVLEIDLPRDENNSSQSLTLGFKQP